MNCSGQVFVQPFLTCTNPTRLAKIITMKLMINGEECSLNGPLTLTGLLTRLEMKSDRVAVELNLGIVPRDQWTTTNLAEGDRLEIVHFVGGGSSVPLSVDGDL
jgi:thiamine biosynthesis protein ThiS